MSISVREENMSLLAAFGWPVVSIFAMQEWKTLGLSMHLCLAVCVQCLVLTRFGLLVNCCSGPFWHVWSFFLYLIILSIWYFFEFF